MTTVIALARDGRVAMAADTCVNVYERPVRDGASKILRFPAGRGEALIGCAGNGGLLGVLAAGLVVSEPTDPDAAQSWAHSVARRITELALEAHLTQDGQMEGTMILGWRGRLWTITHMLAIPHVDGVAAIGSGEGPAIGAADALLALALNLPLAQIAVRACSIGILRDRYSALPIDIQLLPAPAPDADPVG